MQNKINIQIYFQLFFDQKKFGIVMKNAILYNIITADVQTGTQSSTIKKNTAFAVPKTKKNMNKLL